MNCAIIQSSYIPWKGYFDIIAKVDCFVFLDDVQFTRRDWRTRNKIKFPDGRTDWLSIPVAHPDRNALINEVQFTSNEWMQKHCKTILHSYRKAPFYVDLEQICAEIYAYETQSLSLFNQAVTKLIAAKILLKLPQFINSADLHTEGTKSVKLINILKMVGAERYLSGPSAKAYIDGTLFNAAGIDVSYMEYGPYPEYTQLYGDFDHYVSILDLIANVGCKHALEFIVSGAQKVRVSRNLF